MKTVEDLPFLRAQAAELERLIRIAPPTAVIAKYQYEEQFDDLIQEIQEIVNGKFVADLRDSNNKKLDDSIIQNAVERKASPYTLRAFDKDAMQKKGYCRIQSRQMKRQNLDVRTYSPSLGLE